LIVAFRSWALENDLLSRDGFDRASNSHSKVRAVRRIRKPITKNCDPSQ
jgi:hypothetical protein